MNKGVFLPKLECTFSILLAISFCSSAIAGPAITDFVGKNTMDPTDNLNLAWKFTLNKDITVTHLGLYDHGSDGLSIDHELGIWDMDNNVRIASGMLHAGTGDTLINKFRYVEINDLELTTGTNYEIVVYSDSPNNDTYYYELESFVSDPAVNVGLGFAGGDPQIGPPGGNVRDWPQLGPNFLFTTAVIPAPAAILLGCIGFSFVGWLRRNKKL